jgi:hypothetical protein
MKISPKNQHKTTDGTYLYNELQIPNVCNLGVDQFENGLLPLTLMGRETL